MMTAKKMKTKSRRNPRRLFLSGEEPGSDDAHPMVGPGRITDHDDLVNDMPFACVGVRRANCLGGPTRVKCAVDSIDKQPIK